MGRSGNRRRTNHGVRRLTDDGSDRPEWSDVAAFLYSVAFSDEWVTRELAAEGWPEVTTAAVGRELRSRPDVRRRPAPPVIPYMHDGLSHGLAPQIEARIEREAESRRQEGWSDNDVYDWKNDQRIRYSPVEHLCYSDDPLFNSRDMVEAMIRWLKKYHAACGRPVAGEAFEDILAHAWRDVGHNVFLAPRNNEGPDVHIALQNQWVALSMKSEARELPRRDLQITSLAPHHQEINDPQDCIAAVEDALDHLSRYERMIYLRVTGDRFPTEPQLGLRYTLLELPKRDIQRRLRKLTADAFACNDFAERNTFSADVHDASGKRLFRVSISRQPPRVAIVSLAFGYSKLITSYWLNEPIELERLRHDGHVG